MDIALHTCVLSQNSNIWSLLLLFLFFNTVYISVCMYAFSQQPSASQCRTLQYLRCCAGLLVLWWVHMRPALWGCITKTRRIHPQGIMNVFSRHFFRWALGLPSLSRPLLQLSQHNARDLIQGWKTRSLSPWRLTCITPTARSTHRDGVSFTRLQAGIRVESTPETNAGSIEQGDV